MPIANGVIWKKSQRGSTDGDFVLLDTGETFASENEMSDRQAEYDERKWKCRHEEDGSLRTFVDALDEEKTALDKLRTKMSDILVREICELAHHSPGTKDQLLEKIKQCIDANFFTGERVKFRFSGREYQGQIVRGLQNYDSDASSCEQENEKRYDIETLSSEKSEIICGIPSHLIRRCETISVSDIAALISLTAQKVVGTNFWTLDEGVRNEFNIANKVHSIFTKCRISPLKTNHASSKPDDSKVIVRRSAGLAPSSSIACKQQGLFLKRQKEEQKHPIKRTEHCGQRERVNDVKRAKMGSPASGGTEARGDLPKEKNLKPALKRQLSKEDTLQKASQKTMYKFLLTSPGTSSPNVVVPSPRSMAEKRLEVNLQRILKLFPSPDPKEFRRACTLAMEALSPNQIESIPYPEIRYAVTRQREQKDEIAECLKLLPQDRRKFQRQKWKERMALHADMERKLQILLNKKPDDRLLEDLKVLPSFSAVEVPEGHEKLFGTCLVITEFLNTFQSMLAPEYIPSAEQLITALHAGQDGAKLIFSCAITFMNTLLQSTSAKKYSDFGVPFKLLPVTPGTVSELVRIVLGGKPCVPRKETKAAGEQDDDPAGSSSPAHGVDLSCVSDNITSEEMRAAVERLAFLGLGALEVHQQIEILKGLVECVQQSSAYSSFLNEAAEERFKVLDKKKTELQKSLAELNQKLVELPPVSAESMEELTRREALIQSKIARDREHVERRIDAVKVKLESSIEQYKQQSNMVKKMMRLEPLGVDRENRRYWFFEKSPNGGIYIENGWNEYSEFSMKTANAEHHQEIADETRCKAGPISPSREHAPATSDIMEKSPVKKRRNRVFEAFEQLVAGESSFPVQSGPEEWRKIGDIRTLDDLMSSLAHKGNQESKLLSKLRANYDTIVKSFKLTNTELDVKEDVKFCDDLASVREEISDFESELRKRRFTKIENEEDFMRRVEAASSVDDIRFLLSELVDSIPERDFSKKLASGTIAFSLSSWKACLEKAVSASQLSVLLHALEVQINWDYSLRGKKCRICNIGRYQDEFIVCEQCGLVLHLFCVRPKLDEMPPGGIFVCNSCRESEEKSESESKSDEDEDSAEEDSSTDGDYQTSDEEEDEEPDDPAAYTQLQKKLVDYFSKLKKNREVYEWISLVHDVQHSSIRAGHLTLRSISGKLLSYPSEYKLKCDLRVLFKAASLYYADDEKKRKRLEALKKSLDL